MTRSPFLLAALLLATAVLANPVSAQPTEARAPAKPKAGNVPSAPTPEQDRRSLLTLLQPRFPAVLVDDWSMGSAALSPGIAVTPLGGAHATNVNDIIAIGKKRWEQPFRPAAAATAAPASKEARVLKNFSHCFANGGRRIAATYPQVDAQSGAVVTLEDAINECLALHGEPALDTAKPSDALMLGALSAYVRSLAVGQKLNIRVANAAARAQYLAGREWFTRRIGDKNLACASCHAVDAGKTLEEAGRTRVLSPVIGQVLAWPRVEPGGGVRLLQHQFQRCMVRAGAEPFAFGSQEFNQLEYFLSAMSNGLTVRPAMPTD